MKYPCIFALIYCCLISHGLFAQTPGQIEAELMKSFNRINYWEKQQYHTTNNLNGFDSIQKANRIFQAKLKRYTSKYPFTLDQEFKSIAKLPLQKPPRLM